jgi:hypothetical protein
MSKIEGVPGDEVVGGTVLAVVVVVAGAGGPGSAAGGPGRFRVRVALGRRLAVDRVCPSFPALAAAVSEGSTPMFKTYAAELVPAENQSELAEPMAIAGFSGYCGATRRSYASDLPPVHHLVP